MKNTFLHPTAIIEEGAKIGDNCNIGPFCIISSKTSIGNNVTLKSNVIIDGKVTIGDNNIIFPFASLSLPQTLKYKGEDSEIIIGNNNVIREYVTIQHGTKEGIMKTIIGDNCLLMVGVHIAHNCIIGNNVIFANYASLAGHVKIDDYVIIGGLSAIQQFVHIGKHAMIGGMSGIDKNIIPFGLASNERANLQGLNLLGMKRRKFNNRTSIEAHKIIKNIFQDSSLSMYQKIEYIKNHYSNNEILMEIMNFINNKQNICVFNKSKLA